MLWGNIAQTRSGNTSTLEDRGYSLELTANHTWTFDRQSYPSKFNTNRILRVSECGDVDKMWGPLSRNPHRIM